MLMTVIYGDLFTTKADVIAHQVNCLGVMGAGVAKQVRSKYPSVYKAYSAMCATWEPNKLLGAMQFIPVDNGNRCVANLFGQLGIRGSRYEWHTDHDALYQAMRQLRDTMLSRRLYSVAMPYAIGCGLGGGDLKQVHDGIKRAFDGTGITVELWKLN